MYVCMYVCMYTRLALTTTFSSEEPQCHQLKQWDTMLTVGDAPYAAASLTKYRDASPRLCQSSLTETDRQIHGLAECAKGDRLLVCLMIF